MKRGVKITMTHDELLNEWDKDSTIDPDCLDTNALEASRIHAKYLRILSSAKMKHAAIQNEYNVMRKIKYRYYRGELSREELSQYGWQQWQGTKPIKSEADELLSGDEDLGKLRVKIEYMKVMIDTTEAILKDVSNRQWAIRNAIEYRKFISGV